jgi:hypothetical protein
VKSLRTLVVCASVFSFVPVLASADEESLTSWAQRKVDEGLIKPLAALRTPTFSRARQPPRERRVRITQGTASADKDGRSFVPFAVDVRFGTEWRENDIVGCAYTGSGSLFVKVGDEYRPAAFLLGKDLQAVAGACEPAGGRS